MDSRPGSTTSLLRTVIGLYLRETGGWMASSALVELMQAMDIPATLTRTALTRLRKKAVVVSAARDGMAGYELDSRAARMLERGDRRIHAPRSMDAHDPWCLISFSLPESERERRHQLRRQLHWIGCGMVSPGLWVAPDYLRKEVAEILESLGLGERAVLFTTSRPHVIGELRDVVAGWWDLDAIATLYLDFIKFTEQLPQGGVDAAPQAFATYVNLIDRWRMIPYLDPGLPTDCLPSDWPGGAGVAIFQRISKSHAPASKAFVASVTAPR
ncbi:PaaX family transcriptional regulator C-terminal domain-containing protein [Arthrobacter sp. H35-D1]|uniref:PaaX family transcriptional regulator n=1 Tax=Arthrobacter sp. H35-D1 TaxID=3046202 RepID=UPI0024BB05B3|nr:PaaX family transcriptional regulator C-terminal domain-containing protein [Arthrobacter sp. H35-D1]MDJ0314788.1 PaaX family transcriptional regulator C-terminal domain-containing protein [Arthrobacter sp. H35-D1]